MQTMHFKPGTDLATLHRNPVSAAGVWMVAREIAIFSKPLSGAVSFYILNPLEV
jgi:hypothetical protein